ncbi:lipopolysaccharide biosynthesis protein [Dysgonomonas capnocytophagoides]|uniref:lipopolysaccharide biosynthesis protein n=1 Tax=Dysgonomonas capnocytophagoides TaxID=45254 RepID=UPI003341C439
MSELNSSSTNNKRIAKNTMVLYFRMLLLMLVSLYTVRIVLKTLGIVDYGIYNVVGGVVSMFVILSSTMATASQRFFAFDIGSNNTDKLKQTFSLTFLLYILISIVVLVLGETLGLWFLNNKMQIPESRIDAANWVYQFAILSFIASLVAIPYNAIIIARERMTIYAYVSIAEVILKLLAVFFLMFIDADKLKLYAVLMFIVSCFVTVTYYIICRKRFIETRYQFFWDKEIFVSLFSFSSWKLIGSLSGLLGNQGLNILMNVFFGPAINAAKGISTQINTVVTSFSNNFYMSVRPQITKAHAENNTDYSIQLMLRSSKFAFFLLLVISLPILFKASFVLNLWLDETTLYMIYFTKLVIIYSLINSLENPLTALVQATGNIRKYEVFVGAITLLVLPISYILYKLGFSPEIAYYIQIGLCIIALFVRLYILRELFSFKVSLYLNKVLFIILLVLIVAIIPPLVISFLWDDNTWFNFIMISIICVLSVLCSVYFIGLESSEKKWMKEFILKKIQKR